MWAKDRSLEYYRASASHKQQYYSVCVEESIKSQPSVSCYGVYGNLETTKFGAISLKPVRASVHELIACRRAGNTLKILSILGEKPCHSQQYVLAEAGRGLIQMQH